jgi:arylsulfatase A-like enzyme
VLFERAFVTAPSCTPSRNGILTGQPFYRLGEGANLQSALDVAHPNFMRRLADAGYQTGHWRKVWGPGVFEAGGYEQHPCGPETGFDAFLERRAKDQPFCFMFGAYDPHRPYDAGQGAAGGVSAADIRVPPFLPDHETVRSDIADYYFEVERWDRDVARAIELLEQAGELENTIIVMTGDNGMPFPRCKGNLYDWGSRAPLAIRWGNGIAAPGRRTDAFVSLIDLAPTFLAAAGVDVPAAMTGRSLLPLLRNEETKPGDDARRDFAVYGRERHAAAQAMPSLDGYPARAIRTDRWLYIMNLAPDRWPAGVPDGATHPIERFPDCDNGPTKRFIIDHRDDPRYRHIYDLCFARRPADELYDVQADPDQVENVAGDPAHRETIRQLRDQLTTHLRDTGDPRFTDQPVKFDDYPYRDERVHRRIRAWREQQSTSNAPAGAAAVATDDRPR